MSGRTLVFTIIGAESTGKTTLTLFLARHFQSPWISEYARFYVEQLNRPYKYEDVVHIARTQIWLYQQAMAARPRLLFIDTDLIITKIWFTEVFGKYPSWLDQQIINTLPNAYLFCETDLAWQPDPVRENPGQRREYLSELYKKEIRKFKVKMHIIKGKGKVRLLSGINFVNFMLDNSKNF